MFEQHRPQTQSTAGPAFLGFLFKRKSEMFFFYVLNISGTNPCHVGKTFAPQLGFVAGYCTGSGISLMK